MRVTLSPTRRLWRDEQTLQLGRQPGSALVLAGLSLADRAALALLDGTRDVADVLSEATRKGCRPERVRELLERLTEAGLLVDDAERWPPRLSLAERDRLRADVASLGMRQGGSGLPALRRRDLAQVRVVGGTRVGTPLAVLLAGAGVGAVEVVDDGTVRPEDVGAGGFDLSDLGRRRSVAAHERLAAVAPACSPRDVLTPHLVVLAAGHSPAALLDVPHLLVEVREQVGVVGPLVVPGRTSCLRCLDHTRTDRDPAWPSLVAQLSLPARAPEACDSVLVAAVVAHAALQTLSFLDGTTPAAVGGSLELTLPDWRWRRRTWAPHPACGCLRRAPASRPAVRPRVDRRASTPTDAEPAAGGHWTGA